MQIEIFEKEKEWATVTHRPELIKMCMFRGLEPSVQFMYISPNIKAAFLPLSWDRQTFFGLVCLCIKKYIKCTYFVFILFIVYSSKKSSCNISTNSQK